MSVRIVRWIHCSWGRKELWGRGLAGAEVSPVAWETQRKKNYIYLKTIASRKISWLIIRFPIKIAKRLGAPCAQPPLVFANFRRRAKIATLESAPLLHPRNGSDLWITSERKRSIIVKGICVQGFWPNWVTAYDVFGSIENEWSSFSGPYYYLYLNKISDFQRVPAPEMSEAQRGQDGRMGWTLSCLEMLRHAADVTAWGELIGLQRQRASEELQAICRCGA